MKNSAQLAISLATEICMVHFYVSLGVKFDVTLSRSSHSAFPLHIQWKTLSKFLPDYTRVFKANHRTNTWIHNWRLQSWLNPDKSVFVLTLSCLNELLIDNDIGLKIYPYLWYLVKIFQVPYFFYEKNDQFVLGANHMFFVI